MTISFTFGMAIGVGFHEVEVQTVIGSLGLGGLVLLLFYNQREVGVCCDLDRQLLVLSTEALASFGEAGLGAGDGLVDEVDGEADGGGGDDRHGDFLSGSYGLAVGRNPD